MKGLLDISPRWGTRCVDFGGAVDLQRLAKHGFRTSQKLKRYSLKYRFGAGADGQFQEDTLDVRLDCLR
jgi:hypothetical protein